MRLIGEDEQELVWKWFFPLAFLLIPAIPRSRIHSFHPRLLFLLSVIFPWSWTVGTRPKPKAVAHWLLYLAPMAVRPQPSNLCLATTGYLLQRNFLINILMEFFYISIKF